MVHGEMRNLPIPHIVNSVVYLDFVHLPHFAGHNFPLLVTCGLSRFLRVIRMNKEAGQRDRAYNVVRKMGTSVWFSKGHPL